MSNVWWYSCLALTGVTAAALTIYIKRRTYKPSTLIAFYLFATGITWIGEYIALGIFNSYAYKCDIIDDRWAQNLMGHLFLNTTIYPAAAIIMVAWHLRYRWIPVFVAYFVFAEYLFLKLGLYEQHWWRYYMSVIIVVAFLLISKSWFIEMDRNRRGLVRAITYYFIGMVIIHMPYPFLLLLNKQYYSFAFIVNIVHNRYWASILFTFGFDLIMAYILMFCVCILKKWYWKLVPYLAFVIWQSLLAYTHISIFQDGWTLLYTLLVNTFTFTTFILIEKYTWKP